MHAQVQNNEIHRWWYYAFAAALVLLIVTRTAGAAGAVGIVYYQATYSDGRVRDLNEPPQTKENIRQVLRITRYQKGQKGYHVLTTEGPAYRKINTGLTEKVRLRWNGRAWAAPRQNGDDGNDETSAKHASPVQREIAQTEAVLERLKKKLAEADHAVEQARRETKSTEDKRAKAAAEVRLKKTRAERKDILATIKRYETSLRVLKSLREDVMGRVEEFDNPPEEVKKNESSRMERRRTLPGRVYVHKLPAAEGRRTYYVSAPHPEAGQYGAFYFVVYADTDDDGEPDKLIGCSPLAQTERPGRWSRWSFETSRRRLFMGRAFVNPTAGLYCARYTGRGSRGHRGDSGSETTEVYVSGGLGVVPHKHYEYWPYLSNIHIRVDEGEDSEYTGPQIIIR